MLTLLFIILMFITFGKILKFAVKATWSISKIVFSLVLLPLFLVGLVLKGLIALAFPVLLIIAVISILVLHD
ncbi:MAG: hypothetical protein IJ374_04960 [Lachnospiraceae bacterium]|nr:hypothetical protein [Lachnospiraceae bacterium]